MLQNYKSMPEAAVEGGPRAEHWQNEKRSCDYDTEVCNGDNRGSTEQQDAAGKMKGEEVVEWAK